MTAVLVSCSLGPPLAAQHGTEWESVRPRNRILGRIDDQVRSRLSGNRHPLARPEFDLGRVPADTLLERMTLVLLPDAAQQTALQDLLEAQQDLRSPLYHQWLTPQEFGRHFGASEEDLGRVVAWLEAGGFTVEPPPAGGRWLVFSGTAAQVESAFHTGIHTFLAGRELHRANAADPEIPRALAEVLAGVVGLHDFFARPQHQAQLLAPEFTSGGRHYITPDDFSAIYDVQPLYHSGIDGSGQSIAIVARGNVAMDDVAAFRTGYALPAGNPTVVLNGPDPGILSGNERIEPLLDVELAGAVAPKAGIQLVVSKSTAMADGIVLSAEYIVEHNLAPIVSMSFGTCEATLGSGGNQFWNALWQQAAAQGMTVLVSSGDSGAAGCDNPVFDASSGTGSVNGVCSSPYSTCVGGTQFADGTNPALFWAPSDSASGSGSAVAYIPEAAWNESALSPAGAGLWAGGGGASTVYRKPSWQTGQGVPTENHRYVPDVALNSAMHDGFRMVANGESFVASGTSVAAPAFAGVMALAAQRQGARLGNANPGLYTLARLQSLGGASVFHDIVAGDNSVPGLTGYAAGRGYDAATGLGSVDALMLVNSWGTAATPVASFHIGAPSSALSLVQGKRAYLPITITPSAGFSSPVTLAPADLPEGLAASFAPGNIWSPGAASPILILASTAQIPPGSYRISVTGTAGGVTESMPITVTVIP